MPEGFNYDKWIDHFQKCERAGSDQLAKGKFLFGLQGYVNLCRDVQTMLKELKGVSK